MDSIERISSHPALAEAEILRLRGLLEQRWRSVDLPPMTPDANVVFESHSYLVTDGKTVSISEFARGNCAGKHAWAAWSMYGGIKASKITHWMPLPEPPTCTDTTAAL